MFRLYGGFSKRPATTHRGMVIRRYTEAELGELRSMPKRVTNPRTRWLEKPRARPSHRQRNFAAIGERDETIRFAIYQRRNLTGDDDFSCGIALRPPDGPPLTLARYNGASHAHGDIAWRPHIHRATEAAIAAGRKPESEAEETGRYETIEGAMACLVEDFNVRGIAAGRDTLDLFPR